MATGGNKDGDLTVAIGGNSGAQLKQYLERIERQADEKAALQQDIRDIFTEAKLAGFNPKIMRIILKRRAMDASERDEQDALIQTYEDAVTS